MSRQAVEQRLISCRLRGRLIDNDDIAPRQCPLVLSKRLADYALDSVSVGRLPAMLFRDRQAEPRGSLLVLSAKHRKPFVATARRFLEHPAERRSIEQPLVLFEPV